MSTTYPPPAPPVVGGHPRHHSGRGNHPINRIVIHSAVIPCEPGRARQLGSWNASGATRGSWHYAVDPAETIQCSYDSYICWHAPPNSHSIGIEMADLPSPWPTSRPRGWFRALALRWRWRGTNHRRMLDRTARLTAELALAYDIPIVWLRPRDLSAGRRGITTHAQVSAAWRQSSHWDPGAWPRRRFMRLVRTHADQIRRRAARKAADQ